MTDEQINKEIMVSIGYEQLVIDYESLTEDHGLTQGEDGVWRTPSHNKWLDNVEAQEVKCVGNYFVRLSDGAIFADFDGPDNGINGRGKFKFSKDLNAVHEAVLTIESPNTQLTFGNNLIAICDRDKPKAVDTFHIINATARQRAEAFLRTLGKWKY